MRCRTDDVTDVTVSDDDVPTTALPPTSEDPRHPDVAFAHALVNSCLRAPLPVSTNTPSAVRQAELQEAQFIEARLRAYGRR